MNSLTAAELKRRGMAAIEEGLRRGPVHLVKRNKPTAVVISAKEYARLSGGTDSKLPGMTAFDWLLKQPRPGNKGKEELDRLLRNDRDDWA
jgi:prevent-host-death family protein